MKPPGIGPRVFIHVAIYQGKPFWGYLIFDQPTPAPFLDTEFGHGNVRSWRVLDGDHILKDPKGRGKKKAGGTKPNWSDVPKPCT